MGAVEPVEPLEQETAALPSWASVVSEVLLVSRLCLDAIFRAPSVPEQTLWIYPGLWHLPTQQYTGALCAPGYQAELHCFMLGIVGSFATVHTVPETPSGAYVLHMVG